eukprot:TRINITY_DN2369_c0_g1_i1.p1 TRINITY_DN2369_c0_g1~~TRINITY_DN2369_c0_g1_i1.p1  ORF type:complete len:165 (+),score=13.05 TRINITY_DN2369_c0_g1_i1:27-521(+)
MGYGFISEGETLAFIVSAVFGSSISFFSGLVLLFLIFYYRKHRLSYWRLILGFGIVGILQDVCYFSGAVLIYSEKQDTSYGNFFCKTQGFALQIAGGTSAMYSIMICLHIYFIIVQKWVTIPKKTRNSLTPTLLARRCYRGYYSFIGYASWSYLWFEFCLVLDR